MATAKCPRCGEFLRLPQDAARIDCPTCGSIVAIKSKPKPIEPPQAKSRAEITEKVLRVPDFTELSFGDPAAERRPLIRPSRAPLWICLSVAGALLVGLAAVAGLLWWQSSQPVAVGKKQEPAQIKAAVATTAEPAKPAIVEQPTKEQAAKKPEPKEPAPEPTPFQREAKRFCEEALVFLNLLDTEPPVAESETQLRALRQIYSRLPFSSDPGKAEKQREFFGLVYKLLETTADSYLRYRTAVRLAGRDSSPEVLATLNQIREAHNDGKRRTRDEVVKLLNVLEKSKKKM